MAKQLTQTFKELVSEVRARVQEVDSRLDAKIQERDELTAAFCAKPGVMAAFTRAVDEAAGRFEPKLHSALLGAGRRPPEDRHRVFDHLPALDPQYLPEALCYFCRDLILGAAGLKIDTLHWPGGKGVEDGDRAARLAVLETEIEAIKEERDALLDELREVTLPGV